MPKFAARLPRDVWYWGAFGTLLTLSVLVLMTSRPVGCFLQSRRARAFGDICLIVGAAMEYATNHDGEFPSSLEELVIPDERGFRYLASKSVPLDPWGRAYIYRRPTPTEPLLLVLSLGRDGEIGGQDEDADIDSNSISGQ